MDRKLSTVLILFGFVIFLGFLCATLSLGNNSKDNLAHVYMLNIGQGDSFLIESANGYQMLIDGGKDTKVLTELQKVMPIGDKSIDVIIATHPDADHIGGLESVISRYDIGLFLTSDVMTDTKVFKSLFQKLSDENIPSYYARRGMNISMDENLQTDFKILFPDRETENWETNSASIVGRLQIGDRSALFTGDSPSSVEQYLARTGLADIDVDILKLGHHGSKTSSSEIFLQATSPDLALISAGINNRYGHPNIDVVNRLKYLNIPSISTQDKGTVSLSTDGNKWFVK